MIVSRRTLVCVVFATAAACVAGMLAPVDAAASMLCRTRHKGLIIRDVCRSNEEAIGAERLGQLGFRGGPGPRGMAGPAVAGLRVLDATGADVGVVVDTASTYGVQAQVVRQMVLPGGSGPQFVLFSVEGARVSSDYGCITETTSTYHVAPDCSGEPMVRCDGRMCSPDPAPVFAVLLRAEDDGSACFVRGGAESRRGNFYRRYRTVGSTPTESDVACVIHDGGTAVESGAPCPPEMGVGYCTLCCAPAPDIDVTPVHHLPAGALGTPPFRLAR